MNTETGSVDQSAVTAQVSQLFARGLALHQAGQLAQAQSIYEEILKVMPRHADALHLLGVIASQKSDHQRAVALIGEAIDIYPDNATFYSNRGNALHAQGQNDAALASYDRALALMPGHADAHYNRGVALQELGRLEDAIACYSRAIEIRPDYAAAYSNRGNALYAAERPEAAVASYDSAIACKPDFAEAHSNRGVALQQLKRFDAAVASYDRAIAISPDYAEAYSNRGNALQELRQLDAAVASYNRAVAIRPNYAEAHANRGNALQKLRQLDAALASYDRAIAIDRDYADALANRGNVLKDLKLLEAAVACYERTLAIKPDYEYLFGTTLLAQMRLCDWRSHEANLAKLKAGIERGEKVSHPFPVLAACDAPALQRRAAETFVQAMYPANPALGVIPRRSRRNRIRIGYYSADFRNHAVSYLTAELFEFHNREKFEPIAISFGADSADGMRHRIKAAFADFIDAGAMSDQEVARISREREIDIAVDLGGLTADTRTSVFAFRAAPVQVNYLGYGGTMGADYFDYLIADKTIIPPEAQTHYREKIAYLPSYQANDSQKVVSGRPFTREELGLPSAGFVFCCFSNHYKITPATFDIWMSLLKRIAGSVLWLLVDHPAAAGNLRKEAQRRGVDGGRLVFAGRMPLSEHLARHRLADLFLDTSPCNGGASASDALWAGLPVLTCMGASFVSRVAASLLNAVELPELVTSSAEEYEETAAQLAVDAGRLVEIRRKLERNRLSTLLFDSRRFTQNIESAFAAMYERYLQNLPAEHIVVAG